MDFMVWLGARNAGANWDVRILIGPAARINTVCRVTLFG
jgi:hypothetical protein